MLFTQFEFIFLFVPALLFLTGRVRDPRRRTWLLVGASLLFYGAWNYRFLPLIIGSVLANFLIGRKMATAKNRRGILLLGLVVNLLPIAYFKYFSFIVDSCGIPVPDAVRPNVLPLGISFYTFQQVAYLVDAYRTRKSEDKLYRYSLFVLFFPQLVAGPIVHHAEIIPQLDAPKREPDYFASGLLYFAIGFVKKFLIADGLAGFVAPVFDSEGPFALESTVVATLAYTLQLYFDFSGYSDMAIGLGRLVGFELPVNFDRPYKSRSFVEFWRRWHITLSRWFRDYVYIPLGGSRKSAVRVPINLLVTMLLCGLWHGADWAFVIWGGLHGVLLLLNHVKRRYLPRVTLGPLDAVFTFVAVALLWVLFRAEDVGRAALVYKGFFRYAGWSWNIEKLWVALAFACAMGPSSHQIVTWARERGWIGGRYAQGLSRRLIWYCLAGHAAVVLLAYAFYGHTLDRTLYRLLPVKTARGRIENQKGDYRSNLLVLDVFKGDEKKVVFCGSSFTAEMGLLGFEHRGKQYRSGSAGIGGNSMLNGLVAAMAIIDIENVDTVVLGVSPLNFGAVDFSTPFPGQATEGLRALGFKAKSRVLSEVHAVPVDWFEMLMFACGYKRDRYFQLHGCLQKLSQWERPSSSLPTPIEISPQARAKVRERIRAWHAAAPIPKFNTVSNPPNGADARFRWRHRRCIESLLPKGFYTQAFAQLKRHCDRRRVRLVVYDTPTPRHKAAPHVYPQGFLEQYETAIGRAMRGLGIEYYNLIDLLPMTGDYMMDFIHPGEEQRPVVQEYLLQEIYGRERQP